MKLRPGILRETFAIAIVATLITACANINQSAEPARKITDCPPGQYLICETRQPLSKGGAEEEIPEYEFCRCEGRQ